MALRRGNVTYQTGAMLLLLLCAICLCTGLTSGTERDSGVRAYGIAHVAKDTVKSFTGAPQRTAVDTGAVVGNVPAALALAAFLLAWAVLTATAVGRRRFRLAVVSSRAPPGSSALA